MFPLLVGHCVKPSFLQFIQYTGTLAFMLLSKMWHARCDGRGPIAILSADTNRLLSTASREWDMESAKSEFSQSIRLKTHQWEKAGYMGHVLQVISPESNICSIPHLAPSTSVTHAHFPQFYSSLRFWYLQHVCSACKTPAPCMTDISKVFLHPRTHLLLPSFSLFMLGVS